ncbi:MAG: hypothetical protein VB023_06070 [Oscillibacter sp.]|nr:hypothetical protein [Oscillibacter sp.]
MDSTKYRQCKIIKEYVFKDAFLDTKFDSEIVRGYFLCRLINVLQAAKQDFLAPFNDQSLYAWLDHVEIDFFKPIDFIEGENLDFIERLCRSPELLQENFQEILSYMSPYIVADWDEFLTPDNLGEVKHRDSAALLILYFVLKKAESMTEVQRKWAQEGKVDALYESLTDEDKRYISDVLRLKEKAQILSCMRAIFYRELKNYPNRVNGTITDAIKMYRKYYVPMSKLLEDYSDAMKHTQELERAIDPWLALNRGIKKVPVEGGMSVSETVFERAAFQLKAELPTDVIRAVFYPLSRNDAPFECSFLLPQLTSLFQNGQRILIVNPSPDFILAYQEIPHLEGQETYYAATDDTVAYLYSKQFPKNHFISFSKISNQAPMDLCLVMARDYPMEKLETLLSDMWRVCAEESHILAVLPNALIDSDKNGFLREQISQNDLLGMEAVLLSSNITNSSPRKKVLLHFVKTKTPVYASYRRMEEQQMTVYMASRTADQKSIFVERQHCCLRQSTEAP